MNAALTAFKTGVKDLRWHIDALDIEWKLLATPRAGTPYTPRDEQAQRLQMHVGAGGAAKRRFDYNSVVISLYGLLENYVESLLAGYLAALSVTVPKYADLPEAIRESHIPLSTALIGRAGQSRYKGAVTAEGVIANLHGCLTNATPYRLNADAFTYHSANFRAAAVDELFAKVGITGISQRIRPLPPFSEYLLNKHPGRESSKIEPEVIFYHLNDLAERRNEVGHGAAAELLSNDILRDYVEFVDHYCEALHALVQCHFAEHLVRHKGVKLGAPIKVFDNSIVCLELSDVKVCVGDLLIAITGNSERPFLSGSIQGMQVDKVDVDRAQAPPPVKVGMKVLFKAKENYEYAVVPRT
jgi:hypothetical protein